MVATVAVLRRLSARPKGLGVAGSEGGAGLRARCVLEGD